MDGREGPRVRPSSRRCRGRSGMDSNAATRAVREEDGSPARHLALLNLAPVGLFETDAEGNCRFVNRRWCELAGMSPEQASGTGWVQALHPEDRDRVSRG